MRRHATRTLLLCALVLLALSGLGALASGLVRAEMEGLRVGEPRQGDRFVYGTPDGEPVRSYRWNGTRETFDEWGHPLKADVLEVETPEGLARYGFAGGADQAAFYEGEGGRAEVGGGEQGAAFLQGSNASTLHTVSAAMYPGARPVQADLPCLERGGWQGRTLGEVAGSSLRDLCPSDLWADGLEARGVQDFRGILGQRFVLTLQGHPLKAFWLAPEVPYPLGVAECRGFGEAPCDDPSDAGLVLLGYEAGQDGPLLPPAPPRPEGPATPLALKPLHRGAPADAAGDFSLDEALDAIEQDESLAAHRAFMRDNPGAPLVFASYFADPAHEGADPQERWDLEWADAKGGTSRVASVEDGDCRVMPPLPLVAPPGPFPCRPANTEYPTEPCACDAPPAADLARVLPFAEALRLFSARRATDEPLMGYQYHLRRGPDGAPEATILVMAGSLTPAPEPEEGPLPPLQGAAGRGVVNGDSVMLDALTGRVVYQSYTAEATVTWDNRSGLLDQVLAPAAPRPGMAASPVPLAAAQMPRGVYAATAALGFATLVAALLGARAFAGIVLLYTRLASRDVAKHPRRAAVLRALAERPGLSLQELEEATQVRGGALRHHVGVLVRSGHLARLESGGSSRHFLAGSADHLRLAQEAVLLAGGAEARLLARLRERPGAHAAQLARDLGVSRPAVHLTLQRLTRRGLVQARREGRRSLLFALERGP